MTMNPSWQEALKTALKKNRREPQARYLQLATVAADGSPRNRTVVFRGFADASDDLLVVTDTRNEKVGELIAEPRVELCWYFAITREQFRIRARCDVLDGQTESSQAQRLALWGQLSEAAAEQFFWAHPGDVVGSSDSLPVSPEPPSHFVGLSFAPQFVDYLSLKHPQQRVRYQWAGGEWCGEAVNP
jgi:pyridoxamine 5'-phosphate oxidase